MLRQTGHPAYEERRWIVTLPDGQPGGIPNSWAIPVENYTEGELPAEEERQTNEGAGGQRAGVTQLLTLVKICGQIKPQPEEADDGEDQGSETEDYEMGTERETARMGCVPGAEKAGDGGDTGGDAAEQPTEGTGKRR